MQLGYNDYIIMQSFKFHKAAYHYAACFWTFSYVFHKIYFVKNSMIIFLIFFNGFSVKLSALVLRHWLKIGLLK